MKPLYITIRKMPNVPGINSTVLEIRVRDELLAPKFDRTATIGDADNVASRAQMLDSLISMIKGAQNG